jgi:cold shock CspA family protein
MKQPYISLSTQGLGKIIIDNKESNIISFPSTFKDGDIVDVNFRDNDISNDIISLVAYSKEYYYGFVIEQFSSSRGIILVTYPEIEGTILFNSNLPKGTKVKFKIKKLLNGNTEAVEIQTVSKDDFFKCNMPIFGKIVQKVIVPKEGVIEKVVLEKEHIKGDIKVVKADRGFGFISSEIGDIYFKTNMFEGVYGKVPQKGDSVKFVTQNFGTKVSVKSFIKNTTLKGSLQYGIIDGKKFAVTEYKKAFYRVPQLGDIVYYTDENDIEFKENDTPIVKFIFQEDKNFTNVKSGKISFIKDNFGFIQSGSDSFFFLLNDYKKIYKKEPTKGETVKFSYTKTQKGLQVQEFLFLDIELDKKSFKNFVNIDSTKIYYAYQNGNKIDEIYEYKSNNLNQSISCYRNTKDNIAKLEAIECIIDNNYSSKKITKEKLKQDKIKILDKLIQESLKTNNYNQALYYETKYQQEKFMPNRLSHLSKIAPSRINFIDKVKIKRVLKTQYINFIDSVSELKSVQFTNHIKIIQPVELKQPILPKQTYKLIIKD